MIDSLLGPYNPWWRDRHDVGRALPSFHRPVFHRLIEDLRSLPQMISIIGPRRIGKSTLLLQIISSFLKQDADPRKLIYYSFDDPALSLSTASVDQILDRLVTQACNNSGAGATYLFLDEIQKLDRWELYLKKYYDLQYPLKIVISGSASSPIFKKSRESLLGRIKDYHLLPFSFREFALYSLADNPSLTKEISDIYERGGAVQAIVAHDAMSKTTSAEIQFPGIGLRIALEQLLKRYLVEGGFPEVWSLPNWLSKQEYLYENQVRKVIYEDLVLAAEFRKPELLKRFYISLLESPGREINVLRAAGEANVSAAQVEKYLPLLELTDLVYRLPRFRTSPLRVRKGMMKFYLVDLALRNAALRLTESLLSDGQTLGLYAENLVFLALRKWKGTIQMDYYRDRGSEIDFIVHVGPKRFLPVEVKYQNTISATDFNSISRFVRKYPNLGKPILVTKRWEDFGNTGRVFMIPLPLFLLLFD